MVVFFNHEKKIVFGDGCCGGGQRGLGGIHSRLFKLNCHSTNRDRNSEKIVLILC